MRAGLWRWCTALNQSFSAPLEPGNTNTRSSRHRILPYSTWCNAVCVLSTCVCRHSTQIFPVLMTCLTESVLVPYRFFSNSPDSISFPGSKNNISEASRNHFSNFYTGKWRAASVQCSWNVSRTFYSFYVRTTTSVNPNPNPNPQWKSDTEFWPSRSSYKYIQDLWSQARATLELLIMSLTRPPPDCCDAVLGTALVVANFTL